MKMARSAVTVAAGGLLLAGALLGGGGCIRVKSDPVEVKPIHITVDVNIKVDKELSNFFDDIDSARAETGPAGAPK